MLTIYAFSSLPPFAVGLSRDLRVLWAADELGLDYEIRPVDAMQGGLRAPDYLAVQPFGLIPAIEDDGLTLFESGAILFHLARKADGLLPGDANGQALAQQWAFTALNTLEPQVQNLAALDFFHSDEAWARDRRPALRELAARRLAVMEDVLGDRPYIVGDDFSVPDILMTSVLRIIQHTDLLDATPNLAAYKARCEARPAWTRTLTGQESRLAA